LSNRSRSNNNFENHEPLISTISIGEIIINPEHRFFIQGGVVDVKPEGVVILADKEIDLDNDKNNYLNNLDEEINRAQKL